MTSPSADTCHRCGARRDPGDTHAALLWCHERVAPQDGSDQQVSRLLCPACVRAHARDIEAKLPERWW